MSGYCNQCGNQHCVCDDPKNRLTTSSNVSKLNGSEDSMKLDRASGLSRLVNVRQEMSDGFAMCGEWIQGTYGYQKLELEEKILSLMLEEI